MIQALKATEQGGVATVKGIQLYVKSFAYRRMKLSRMSAKPFYGKTGGAIAMAMIVRDKSNVSRTAGGSVLGTPKVFRALFLSLFAVVFISVGAGQENTGATQSAKEGSVTTGKQASTSAARGTAVSTDEYSSSKKGGKKDSTKQASPAAPAPLTAAKSDASDSYRIGIDDDLQISVWHELELSAQVVVRPDGVITLPLVGDIHVVGLTTKELQDQLEEKLKPYVTAPQVTVIVRSIRSRKVYLIGQVAHTGAFPLSGRQTVLQVLATAGGLTPYAKDDIYIMRNDGGERKRIPFSYKKALKGDVSQDIELQPGDMIVVR